MMAKQKGLTLIEVLIALAIIAIAVTAVIKATAQTIRSTAYLENKTIALWVSQQIINEARLGLRALPSSPDKVNETVSMLGRDWYVEANQEDTPNNRIKQLKVSVYASEQEEDEQSPLIRLEGYRYVNES